MAEMNTAGFAALLLLCAGLAWYDFRTRRVPNAVTLPLLAAGIGLNFPGNPWVWAACGLLVTVWKMRGLGGGDAKLWMALLWWVPADQGSRAILVLGLVFLISGSIQMAWRWFRSRQLLGLREPAVWRTIPFVLWFWMVG